MAEESELGKADPIQITRKLQVLRIRDGVARRVALNPTSDLWRQLLISGVPVHQARVVARQSDQSGGCGRLGGGGAREPRR